MADRPHRPEENRGARRDDEAKMNRARPYPGSVSAGQGSTFDCAGRAALVLFGGRLSFDFRIDFGPLDSKGILVEQRPDRLRRIDHTDARSPGTSSLSSWSGNVTLAFKSKWPPTTPIKSVD